MRPTHHMVVVLKTFRELTPTHYAVRAGIAGLLGRQRSGTCVIMTECTGAPRCEKRVISISKKPIIPYHFSLRRRICSAARRKVSASIGQGGSCRARSALLSKSKHAIVNSPSFHLESLRHDGRRARGIEPFSTRPVDLACCGVTHQSAGNILQHVLR